jgi:hypothetical protein
MTTNGICRTTKADYDNAEKARATPKSCAGLTGYTLLTNNDYAELQAKQATPDTCKNFFTDDLIKQKCASFSGYKFIPMDDYNKIIFSRQGYNAQPGVTWADANKAGDYKCNSDKRITTPELNGFCAFKNEADAINECTNDSKCQGYLFNPTTNVYQISNNITDKGGSNFFLKKNPAL